MQRLINQFWQNWKRFGLIVGDVVSSVVLTIFYFSVFAIFAIPFRIFGKPFLSQDKNSNFHDTGREFDKLESFSKEY